MPSPAAAKRRSSQRNSGSCAQPTQLASDDFRRSGHVPRFTADALPANLAALRTMRDMADEKSCTMAQLALAWLLGQGADIIPIAGTRRRSRLRENLAAAAIDLTAADIEALGTALAPERLIGSRYSSAEMRLIQTETA